MLDVLSSLPVAPLSLFLDLHGLDVFFIELKLASEARLFALFLAVNSRRSILVRHPTAIVGT